MLGSIGYDFAIVLDRIFKRMGYQKSLSKYLKDNVKAAVSFMTDFENEMARQCTKRESFLSRRRLLEILIFLSSDSFFSPKVIYTMHLNN